MRPYFKGSYHIIAPDQGGHGTAGPYLSADEEYQTLRSFLLENECREIALVYGASLGVAVIVLLGFFGPVSSEKPFWAGLGKLRAVLDLISYWIISAAAIACIALTVITILLALFS